jgi:hypothetical protein
MVFTKEVFVMAKGGHRRPIKNKKNFKRNTENEGNASKRVEDRQRQSRKDKLLLRQMRGVKWDEEEYSDELEELDDNE